MIALLTQFETRLLDGTLREQVLDLIPVAHTFRDLGGSLLPEGSGAAGKDRILAYLRAHVGQVVSTDELMVVAGIGDYARRVRELRTEEGWPVLSGEGAKQIRADAMSEGEVDETALPPVMGRDDYLLVEDRQDREAAHRWHVANSIRRDKTGSVKTKVLAYLRANVGQRVTGEELRYVANQKNEWPRRTRELRTEDGWPVVTRLSGDPTLPVGVYILAADVQAPPWDRKIREITRRQVMERDHWQCQWQGCGWSVAKKDYDPRFLEVHHIQHHAKGGSNEAENLVTLCNLHHDECHKRDVLLLAERAP